ncbi:MAG TPA: cytidylate kinase-like family protein [Candidatus Methylacidiphilales bacterium]|nr:cytidylate kinase-like family protein [Candidatus Methylacidiphilales bacterium]
MKNDPYIVAAFLKAKEEENWPTDGTSPIITLSRHYGAEGEEIALRTCEILTNMTDGKRPWVVVDKDIAARIIESHHLPKRLARFFSGEQVMSIEEHVEAIVGISMPGESLLEKMTAMIVHLARVGHVVLVGRGAHLITAKFPRAVHVRVIGSLRRRVERISQQEKCSSEEASDKIKTTDENRRRFLATNFQSDVEDPLKYDLIFNTDRISVEEASRLIAHLVSSPNFRDEQAGKLSELRQHVLG